VNKSSTASTTFYYTKDIQYLLHEPLLAKFRDQKALAKKISKALGRNDVGDAARFEKNLTPKLKLDHIIKERYPTFVDALRDLDDALSMLFLFANLPGNQNVPPKMIARCQRLTMEFEHFLIRTHAMRKSFLSIKGIYYQATIQGQDILWLVPYKFVQQAGPDVDFRIMATFVEFYATLLSFVNYRLYSSIGLVYPPRFDLKSLEQGAELGAFQLEGQQLEEQAEADAIMDTGANEKAQAEADKLLTNGEAEPQSSYATAPETSVVEADNEPTETPLAALDKFASIDPNADALLQPSLTADAQVAGKLFEPFTIFLSRETPRHALEFLLRSFGCRRVGWSATLGDGAYCDESDPRITHQIVDRPDIPIPAPEDDDEDAQAARKANARVPGRIYVQPQWIWDSVNAGQLQRPDLYAPGATLPPHLSPWVRAKKGEYDPTKPLAEQELEGEAEAAAVADEDEVSDDDIEQSDDEEVTKADLADLADIEQGEGMDVELAGSDSEAEDGAAASDDEFGGFSGDEDEQEPTTEADAHQAELLAEAKGLKVAPTKAPTAKEKVAAAKDKRTKAQREEDEKLEMRKMMAPRRKRKMYEKMVYSNNEKAGVAENLRDKKRKIEKAAKKATK
jgi:pescadillo protein